MCAHDYHSHASGRPLLEDSSFFLQGETPHIGRDLLVSPVLICTN